jgi:hypothetical protein
MNQKLVDPQQWNSYAYVRNNPLRMVDTNGMWPIDMRNAIINGAFGGLSASQRGVLQAASKRVDGYLNGGQTAEKAPQHGMRAWWQTSADARAQADTFISDNESKAATLKSNERNTRACTGSFADRRLLCTCGFRSRPDEEGIRRVMLCQCHGKGRQTSCKRTCVRDLECLLL